MDLVFADGLNQGATSTLDLLVTNPTGVTTTTWTTTFSTEAYASLKAVPLIAVDERIITVVPPSGASSILGGPFDTNYFNFPLYYTLISPALRPL